MRFCIFFIAVLRPLFGMNILDLTNRVLNYEKKFVPKTDFFVVDLEKGNEEKMLTIYRFSISLHSVYSGISLWE